MTERIMINGRTYESVDEPTVGMSFGTNSPVFGDITPSVTTSTFTIDHPVTPDLPPLGVSVPQTVKEDGQEPLASLGGRKFIVGVLLIVIASVFTGMRIMTIEQWVWFTGGVGVAYFSANIASVVANK